MEEGYSKGYDAGVSSGVALGKQEGEALKLVQNVESVMSSLGVDLSRACEILNTTSEEYERCRLLLANK